MLTGVTSEPLDISFASDSAIRIGADSSGHALELFNSLRDSPFELHVGYRSLLVEFDLLTYEPASVLEEIKKRVSAPPSLESGKPRKIRIPVLYEGEDLQELSQITGLPIEEIIKLHSSAEYKVAFLGFSPGFPYLTGLPKELECPRKKTPRLKVPKGCVAIAGDQAGIYPNEGPGGWRLLGTTSTLLFDPKFNPPSLLQPGDTVTFQQVKQLSAVARAKAAPQPSVAPLLEVLDPGLLTTVQDPGRPGYAHLGVSAGGAADPYAYMEANRLVGNQKTAAALEITLTGATFKFLADTWIAITGAEANAELDGKPAEMWRSHPVAAGQQLKIHPATKGVRTYLAVRGGIGTPQTLGSRSTLVSANLGGKPLQPGDTLPTGGQTRGAASHGPAALMAKRLYEHDVHELRVTRGPQWDWFQNPNDFFAQEFTVTDDISRMGSRLQATARPIKLITPKDKEPGPELPSEGIPNGAIQIPPAGHPMVLYCEQRTTGGYPKIANVIRADWFRMGQLRPGTKIRFKEVTLDEAWRISKV